jgi:hypothetical protein
MSETVNIFNYYHNGDIFYSRILINILKKKFKNINYYHSNPTPILCDIENLEEFPFVPNNYPYDDNRFEQDVVNSWIGQRGRVYLGVVTEGNCTFENYFEMCKLSIEYYGIDTPEYEDLLPQINYNRVPNIESVKVKLSSLILNYTKTILICNGDVHSGQCDNFDFTNIVNNLSKYYPNILFLVTQKINTDNNNVIFCGDITNTIPDLLQISYISTKCDIIVGRASGPYCFTQVKENLMNPDKIFIAFSFIYSEAKYFKDQKCKFVWSNDWSNDENIIKVIEENIL